MVQLDVRHPQEGATRRRLGSGAESAGDGDEATVGRIEPAGRLRRSDRPRRRVRRPKRIAVIGSQVSAVDLSQELAINRVNAYTLVGWITSSLAPEPDFPLPQALGGMDELASLVEQHDIDLLLIGSDVPRLHVFDELVRLMDTVTVRVCELSAFYEDAFGHIPVTDINAAWFQYVMHPKFRSVGKRRKRVFDIVVAMCLGVVAAPLLLLAALAIKLEGGRVLYCQIRVGEKGRPFTMYKLRTMYERGVDDDVQVWCSVADPRVTQVGRVLRRLHIDELPQLYNVLRGEMSVVGPRPEQPAIVSRLEAAIAFYSRRHLLKPGLAGWAQLRCGYARSDGGSALKVCHDLYYLKHQSLRFDTVILARTFFTLASRVTSRQHHQSLLGTEPRIAAMAGESQGHYYFPRING
jgi:exopolysaccharide biosynthesis polyprenyl glycosylphosphotransferase